MHPQEQKTFFVKIAAMLLASKEITGRNVIHAVHCCGTQETDELLLRVDKSHTLHCNVTKNFVDSKILKISY